MSSAGVRTICFHEHWTDIQAYTRTTHGDQLRQEEPRLRRVQGRWLRRQDVADIRGALDDAAHLDDCEIPKALRPGERAPVELHDDPDRGVCHELLER
ncbi:MAG TPA: hypothetical protein PLU30_05700 [Verrucomicrobiae bacterium]|nr:hypothetical protein [Verrucomicrobiae bacterium]